MKQTGGLGPLALRNVDSLSLPEGGVGGRKGCGLHVGAGVSFWLCHW